MNHLLGMHKLDSNELLVSRNGYVPRAGLSADIQVKNVDVSTGNEIWGYMRFCNGLLVEANPMTEREH